MDRGDKFLQLKKLLGLPDETIQNMLDSLGNLPIDEKSGLILPPEKKIVTPEKPISDIPVTPETKKPINSFFQNLNPEEYPLDLDGLIRKDAPSKSIDKLENLKDAYNDYLLKTNNYRSGDIENYSSPKFKEIQKSIENLIGAQRDVKKDPYYTPPTFNSDIGVNNKKLMDEVQNALKSDDMMKLNDLVKGGSPSEINEMLGKYLGNTVKENYGGDYSNLFNNWDKLSDEISMRKNSRSDRSYYSPSKQHINIGTKYDKDTLPAEIHEWGHGADWINDLENARMSSLLENTGGLGQHGSQAPIKETPGLGGFVAKEAIHHSKGPFELEMAKRINKGMKYSMIPALLGAGLAGYSTGSKAMEGDYSGAAEDAANAGTLGAYDIAKDAVKGNLKDAALGAANLGSYAVPFLGEARMASDIGSLGGNLAGTAANYLTSDDNKDSVFQKEIDDSDKEQEDEHQRNLQYLEDNANQKTQAKNRKFQQIKDILDNN